jgi:hypothetical protein
MQNWETPFNMDHYTGEFVFLFDLIQKAKTHEGYRSACAEFEQLPESGRRELAQLVVHKGNQHKDMGRAVECLNFKVGFTR